VAEAISRREFNNKLAMVASGAVLFALQPLEGPPPRSLTIAQSLRNDLMGFDGTLLLDDASRQAAAVDFGRIVRRLPMAVLKTFQISRNLPASADAQSVIAMNRTLYERARAMGGTRLTTTAIPFSHADWIRHYGPAWESFRRAKERFDPYNVLTPGHDMFPA